jgi:hypothetical protein
MLELVHDIANGAQLLFASGVGGEAAFATAVTALRNAGADIIVDDLNGLAIEPFFMDGVAATAYQTALNNNVAVFSSAGNRGTSGFETPVTFQNAIVGGTAGLFHNFNAGDFTQTLTDNAFGQFYFQFDEPIGNVNADLRVFVLDANGATASAH